MKLNTLSDLNGAIRLRVTHGMNAHAVQYEAAITFIEVCFASDMAEGRLAVKEVQS